MKRILLLSIIALTMGMLQAAPVDPAAATAIAKNYVSAKSTQGRRMAPQRSDINLVYSEMSSTSAGQAAYYIFNSTDGFVIVSGDDRAREVLAHGDTPLDMNNLPENMKFWLGTYKEQIDYLFSNPQLQVEKSGPRRALADEIESIQPMLTAMWDQDAPYNNECPTINGKNCVTGCGATALSIIFYYWKYPTEETPTVPGYTTYSSKLNLPSLPSTTFDWDNMLDRYYRGGYTDVQATAVAHLMRYLGQSQKMDYDVESSGATINNLLSTVKFFGYNTNAKIINKTSLYTGAELKTDEEWSDIILTELENGRPTLMAADYAVNEAGHFFDIDGFDATDKTYHINWGWGGNGNAYFAMNAFSYGGMTFKLHQQLVVGIEPVATGPTIRTNSSELEFTAYEDSTNTAAFRVRGLRLTGDVVLTLNDPNGVFSLDTYNISKNDALNSKRVNVSYSPKTAGEHTATITMISFGAQTKTITLHGTCDVEVHNPTLLGVNQSGDRTYDVQWQDQTPSRNVNSYQLQVVPVPFFDLRLEESFDKAEFEGTSTTDWASRLDELTTLPGWTGSKVYPSGTDIVLGTNKAKGWVQTPTIDMFYNHGKMTVRLNAKSANATAPLKITCGERDTTITLTDSLMEYRLIMPCPTSDQVQVMFSTSTGKRVTLCDVSIYAGDYCTPIDESQAELITGISSQDTNYQLSNLPSGYYSVRLQSVYYNGETSEWTPWYPFMVSWKKEDVNRDGEITIADVNQVIDVIMSSIFSSSSRAVNDVDGDDEITISDINRIIDRILSN